MNPCLISFLIQRLLGVDPKPLSRPGRFLSSPIFSCSALGLGPGFRNSNKPFCKDVQFALSQDFVLTFKSQASNQVFHQEISCSFVHLRFALGSSQLFEQKCFVVIISLSRAYSPPLLTLCRGGVCSGTARDLSPNGFPESLVEMWGIFCAQGQPGQGKVLNKILWQMEKIVCDSENNKYVSCNHCSHSNQHSFLKKEVAAISCVNSAEHFGVNSYSNT